MNKKLKNIKVLVWDVDGTLYRSPSYYQAIAQNEIGLLAKTKEISNSEAAQLLKEKKKIYKSATRTLVKLGCGGIREVGREIEVENKEKYFKKDPKLLAVFKKLIQFRHLTLRNGTYKGTIETLEALGFSREGEVDVVHVGDVRAANSRGRVSLRQKQSLSRCGGISCGGINSGPSFGPFERVFGVIDDFGTVKPDPVIFKKIEEYTGLPANQHLMIGDRVEVDLVPAKKLGMKTCLVWSQSDDPSVDVSIGKVYDIVKVLI